MIKKLLLCLMCLALAVSPAQAREATFHAVVDRAWWNMDILRFWPIELRETDDVMGEIAAAFAARNDQIDLFIFASDTALWTVKEHGYYAPLNGRKAFMNRLNDLYPAFQDALTAENGDLVGWVIDARVKGMTLETPSALEEAGLTPPETFDELIDCCQAILEAGALPADASLFSTYAYSREGMLDLYMDQYVRASQMEGGTVDFTDGIFAAMVERIRTEVPESDPIFESGMATRSVFGYPKDFDYISKDVLPMPRVLPDRAGLVDTSAIIGVVNPYSRNKAAIMSLLEMFTKLRVVSYVYDATVTEPVKAHDVGQAQNETEAAIALLEAVEDPTRDQLEELEALYQKLEVLEQTVSISLEDIEAYKAMSDSLSILEASPVTYDEALRTAARRFLNGAFDAEGFAKECQDHIAMIYQENGIPMN